MNKKPRRLALHRETLRRLDETRLRVLQGGVGVALYPSDEPNCNSPLCGPTYWKGCEETVAG